MYKYVKYYFNPDDLHRKISFKRRCSDIFSASYKKNTQMLQIPNPGYYYLIGIYLFFKYLLNL